MVVRVRFSPAPTGYLHVGGARSALFNWLYARHTGGTFVLRIEDTDAERSRPELIDVIRDNLSWLGLDWDEEYLQSDRFEQYLQVAEEFLAAGSAYRCDCSQDEVKARAAVRGEQAGGYDGHCRDRGVAPGAGVVIRFRTPDSGVVAWDDLIRGHVEFQNDLLEDFVIVRSSGVPMFHLANAYDDLDMGITHVVRGEDLVNTVPRVLLLRAAMGAADQPVFAHLPLIVNEKRQKLSKRRDDVSVGDFAERGFLPEAMRNYLLTLGWGPKDDIEIRPISEFIAQFELSDINAAPAFFDIRKLESFNAEYIRALSVEDFLDLSLRFRGPIDPVLFERLAPEIQSRLKRLDEIPSFVDWIIGPPGAVEDKVWRKVMDKPGMAAALDVIGERLESASWTADSIAEVVLGVGGELDLKTQLPVRVAVTGKNSGLPLWEPFAAMDRDLVIARIREARARL